MVAITPDSPIGAVFGSRHKKRKLAEDGLGLRTVGDLLRHFPRRYVAATELSEVATPVVGEQLTIVGEVRSCSSAPFSSGKRRQWRTTVRLRTDGPDFSVTMFSPYQNMAERHEAEFRPGARVVFTGKAKQFRGSWQLEQPHGFALDGPEAATLSKLMPVYPLTARLYTWDLQKVVSAALELVTGVPDVFTPELRERYGLLDVMQALRWIHAPDEWSQVGAAQKRQLQPGLGLIADQSLQSRDFGLGSGAAQVAGAGVMRWGAQILLQIGPDADRPPRERQLGRVPSRLAHPGECPSRGHGGGGKSIDQQDAHAAAGQVQSGRGAADTGPDDDDIEGFCHGCRGHCSLRSSPLRLERRPRL